MSDAFRLVNISAEHRLRYKMKQKKKELRSWAERQGCPLKKEETNDDAEVEKILIEWEKSNRGGYQLIYPAEVHLFCE